MNDARTNHRPNPASDCAKRGHYDRERHNRPKDGNLVGLVGSESAAYERKH